MAAATVTQAKTALATALATITGLRTYSRQPDNLNTPFGFPILQSVDYHGAMGSGNVVQTYTVQIIVGRASERSSEALLDSYLSYTGVRAALEADPTLGGVVQQCIVESAGSIGTIDGNDTTYLSIDFRVVVYA